MTIPEDLLTGKRVLVGVTGSIAAYKTPELVRLLIKAGASVKVVMTDAARKFVTPLTFETLSRDRVLLAENESWADTHNHIGAAQWADTFVIAPCSANTINKLANGIGDNLLLQCALAFAGPKLIAPSANTQMLHNTITEGSLKRLQVFDFDIIASQTKELACRTTGDGAMAEPLEIFWHTARALLSETFWKDRRVVVTGGGTIEKIDDVRYLSNFSSGKMASAIASALFARGADVNLIATRFDAGLPRAMHTLDVESSAEMNEYLIDSVRIAKKGRMSRPSIASDEPLHVIQKTPYLFMAAAVSDYLPSQPQSGKLKKAILGARWELELIQNVDLFGDLDKTGIKAVAFKAETDGDAALENARALIRSKGADAVCLNVLEGSQDFGTDHHALTFLTESTKVELPRGPKLSLALNLLEAATQL